MTIDLTPILQAIIGLLAALITWKLIPWIRERTTAAQQANLEAVVRVLVYAAEQMYGAGKGAEKLEFVRQQLKARGYDADFEVIEAAVRNYFPHTAEKTLEPSEK